MAREIEDIYPLSPTQQGMLFHETFSPRAGLYVERLRYTLHGTLDETAFERAWRALVQRHAILRSVFIWEEVDAPVQAVLSDVDFTIDKQDWRALSAFETDARITQYLDAWTERGFELTQAPLFRLCLIRKTEDEYEFLWGYHHLLLDGWSVALLLGELIEVYEAYCSDRRPQLENRAPYREYIRWLRQQDPAAAESYWRTLLRGFSSPTTLDIGAPSAAGGTSETYHVETAHAGKDFADALQAFARKHRLTLNTIVQGAWSLLLSHYSNQRDIVFGAVVSGRPPELAGAESMIGMFINTLPVRVTLPPDTSVLPWLQALQNQQIETQRYEHTALAKIKSLSEIATAEPLFTTIVVFENATMAVKLNGQRGSAEIRDSAHLATATGYPITLVVEPSSDDLKLGVTYDRKRYDEQMIGRLLAHLSHLLGRIIEQPEARLDELSPLDANELRALITERNATATPFPGDVCLHELFEQQAERVPDAVAVEMGDEQITYAQLDRLSSQMAAYLRDRGVGPESRVCICLDRSIDMVVAILGVMKAGGAYVPLDPAYPVDRLDFMIRDVATEALITTAELARHLGTSETLGTNAVVLLDQTWPEIAQSRQLPREEGDAARAAYVIYTSGSTGQPKGVVVPHAAVCNHMFWLRDKLALDATDRYLLKTAFSFDASVNEIFSPLLTGARLVLAHPHGHRDTAYLAEAIARHQITIYQAVPSLLRILLNEPAIGACQSLRAVICAGETLETEVKNRFYDRLDANLFNLYGPTEAAIDVTCWPCERAPSNQTIPIGTPIANTEIYLLGCDLQPVSAGVPGELYIGGHNLARGYHNRPALTAERFVPNPFAARSGTRLYRSGDLARWTANGRLEYLGRADTQVKLRGFRIELAEIEACLNQHPDVIESAVTVRVDERGHQRLVAYVVLGDDTAVDSRSLRHDLDTKLPAHMIPALFLRLDALPRTPNGKIDRNRLPAGDESRIGGRVGHAAPRNDVEAELARVWASVLGIEKIGIEDNFFELGGDSILSLQVVGKATQRGLKFTPRDLFENPTVAKLSQVARASTAPAAEQGPITGAVPMTPVQHWFFEQHQIEPHHFNHALMLKVGQTLSPTGLEHALAKLLEHHDQLRGRFEQTASGWQQLIDPPSTSALLHHVDLTATPPADASAQIESTATRLQASFALAAGPLVRAALFDLGAGEPQRLLLVIHHLVVDGVSWRILLEDLVSAYEAWSRGAAITLPAKTTSFKDWAALLEQQARTPALEQEAAYWLEVGATPVTELPIDHQATCQDNTYGSSDRVSVAISEQRTIDLLQRAAARSRASAPELLVTALVETIGRWTGGNHVLIDMEGHGRIDLNPDIDLSRTVGWFTTIFPVLLKRTESQSPSETLRSVRTQLHELPNEGLGYGLLRYVRNDAAMARVPQPQLSFNYLGQFDQLVHGSRYFEPAPEHAGASHSPRERRRYLLEINAFVSGGRLQIEWTYSRNAHAQRTIEKLAEAYQAALERLIEACLEAPAPAFAPADFPLAELDQPRLDALLTRYPDLDDVYRLSPAQEGMLFHSLLSPDAGVYVTQIVYELRNLDVDCLERAWHLLMDHHPILRTAFAWKNLQHPVQVVTQEHRLPLSQHDYRTYSASEQSAHFAEWLEHDQLAGFDLAQSPLMRVSLFHVADDRHRLVWSYHHLLLDGWSVPILTHELIAAYQALRAGHGAALAPAGRPYRDYIAWLKQQDSAQAETFWRSILGGFSRPTPLPYDLAAARDDRDPGLSAEISLTLAPEDTQALETFGRQHGLTQNTLVQGAWALLLSALSESRDVVFGMTLSGRPTDLTGSDSMVGLFINTLPVRIEAPGHERLLPWLKSLQGNLAEVRQYEFSPLSDVQTWSDVPKGSPLFDSIVVYENFPITGPASVKTDDGFEVTNTDFIIRNNFPLTLRAVPGSRMALVLLYDRHRFDEASMRSRLDALAATLRAMPGEANATLDAYIERIEGSERSRERAVAESYEQSRRDKLKRARRGPGIRL